MFHSSSRRFDGTTTMSACNRRSGAPSNARKCNAGSACPQDRRCRWRFCGRASGRNASLRKIVSGNAKRELRDSAATRRERPCGCEIAEYDGRYAQAWRACNPQPLSAAGRRRHRGASGSRAAAAARTSGDAVARDNAEIDRFGPWQKASLMLSATWDPQAYAELRRLIRSERPDVAIAITCGRWSVRRPTTRATPRACRWCRRCTISGCAVRQERCFAMVQPAKIAMAD